MPRKNDLAVPAASVNYHVEVDGELVSYLEDVIVEDESLKHTVLKKNFIRLQETCRQTDIAVRSSMKIVFDFVFERVSNSVAGNVFSNDPSRPHVKMSEL